MNRSVLCKKLKNSLYQIIAIFYILLLLGSCSRSYSGQYFSFPPGSKPHENDWAFLCKIIVWDPDGKRPVEKGKRKIEIIVNDKNKNIVLKDTLELQSASIGSEIVWNELEQLTLNLYERGNKFADDKYNKTLIKEGPNHLTTLTYVWKTWGIIKKEYL